MTARNPPTNPEVATDVRLLARYFVQHEMAPDGAAAADCRKAFAALLETPVPGAPGGPQLNRTPSHPDSARAAAASADANASAAPPLQPTVADILSDPRAPLAAIKQVKKLAKRALDDPLSRDSRGSRRSGEQTVPREAALVLYYLSIAVGQLRHATLATSLPTDVLYAGMHWAEHLPWMDKSTKLLLTRCRRDLQSALARGLVRQT